MFIYTTGLLKNTGFHEFWALLGSSKPYIDILRLTLDRSLLLDDFNVVYEVKGFKCVKNIFFTVSAPNQAQTTPYNVQIKYPMNKYPFWRPTMLLIQPSRFHLEPTSALPYLKAYITQKPVNNEKNSDIIPLVDSKVKVIPFTNAKDKTRQKILVIFIYIPFKVITFKGNFHVLTRRDR